MLERAMEAIFRRHELCYKRQPNLEGRPDFLIKGSNILVFCDSAFWHGHRRKDLRGKSFHKNVSFWVRKLHRNKKRDLLVNAKLRMAGWRVVRFSDVAIYRDPNLVAEKLILMVESNEK